MTAELTETVVTAEQRLKILIGELHFQVALLASQLEEAQKKIAELEKQKAE